MSNECRHFCKLGSVLAIVTLFLLAANAAQAAETKNRLSSNRLAQNRLSSNRLAQNRLSSNALTSTSLEANMATAELLADEGGRELYSYIISCALPEGITIKAVVDPPPPNSAPPDTPYTCLNGECSFDGWLGLAEYWIDHKLAAKEQRWVSACLLARVNLHDTAEAISLRGPHDSFTVSIDEAELYNIAEGAFYGNVFNGPDVPIDWNACQGKGQASGENGGLSLRDCTEEDPLNPGYTLCGFNYAGYCAVYDPDFPTPYACKSFDGVQGTYEDCYTEEGDGKWPSLKTYREVITTYVTF